ncbi:hypothetical protein ISN44_As09g008950 [Arabidopsis suecica]|uniref:Arabidopsis retrotransposon Orf1 C-terminal domain-containing protein n=1 Tax=Arabidopsis suecica TaxID=45249 RepID=A0A8T2AGC4_ARASU|nr:hypothetical protein ISN44_As09g008950 [Arabidopsis suecica]
MAKTKQRSGEKPQEQVAKAQTQKKKEGKRPVHETSGRKSGSECGSGSPKVGKKKAPPPTFTYNNYFNLLKAVEFLPTKYADHKLLSELGIHEAVYQIFKNIGYEAISNAYFLAKQLLYYKWWVTTTNPSSAQLSIGGIINPILIFCGVKLGASKEKLTRIDAPYLSKIDYLMDRLGHHMSLNMQKNVILPNCDITTLMTRDNVIFLLNDDVLYNTKSHPLLDPICGLKTNKQVDVGYSRDALPAPRVIGCERYNFQLYDGPIQNKALRHAHNSINLLQ